MRLGIGSFFEMSQGSGRHGRRGFNKWRGRGSKGPGSSMGAFESRDVAHGSLAPPPPGLKGKALGLYYRDRQKNKKNVAPPKLELPAELKLKIKKTLESLPDKNFSSASFYSSNNIDDKNYKFKKEYLDIISVSYGDKLAESLRMNLKNVPSDMIAEWNKSLKEEHIQKQNLTQYKNMLEFRKNLPAYKKREEILRTIKENQVTVISGETGCGKTTQVGQLILEEAAISGNGGNVNILITQPRRVAATSVARRIAAERAESLGKSVGYTIRLESKTPRRYGSIELVTTGVILQRLQSDPGLLSLSHLILDEVHERDSLCDILIGITKQLLSKRKDLKLILMSATIDAERFCQYYGGCPLIHVPGIMFPVTDYYLEDALELTGFQNFISPRSSNNFNHRRNNSVKHIEEEQKKSEYSRFIKPFIESLRNSGKYSEQTLELIRNSNCEEMSYELIVAVVKNLMKKPEGGILVFVPGFADISKICTMLQDDPTLPPNIILPLHSRLNSLDQQAIFDRPPRGVRKIIVSTNIAETSITIDDIVYVIDTGKMKLTDYDVSQDMSTLKPEWVSEANAHQRRGRAGRVQAGECWRLYTRIRASEFNARPAPELLRAPLHEPLLSTLLLRLGPAKAFLQTLLDPPQPAAVANSIYLLQRMRILNETENLTPLGVHVARLPVAPGAARMLILAALMSAAAPAAAIAAAIAFRDPFILPVGKERLVEERKLFLSKGLGSDQLVAVEAHKQWLSLNGSEARRFCNENFLSWRTLEMLEDMRKQFGDLLYNARFLSSSNLDCDESNLYSHNQSLLKALIVAGLYPNVATYYGKRLRTEEDKMVHLHPGSVNVAKPPKAIRLVYRLKQMSREVYLHDTSPAHALPLLFFGDSYKITPTEASNDAVIVEVGGNRWSTSAETADLLGQLRNALDNLLQSKLVNPGPVDWDSHEGSLLTAIIYLITAEDDPKAFEGCDSD